MIIKCVLIGVGGFLGALLRYLLSLVPIFSWPMPTLVANILGCFLIGILYKLGQAETAFNKDILAMLQIGLCGGFTTFSTFGLDIWQLAAGSKLLAGGYIVLSLGLGLIALWLGQKAYSLFWG